MNTNRLLLVAGSLFVVIAIWLYSLVTQDRSIFIAALLIPVFVFLCNNPTTLAILALSTGTAQITLPMLPSRLSPFICFAVLFSFITAAKNIIVKKQRYPWNSSDTALIAFLGVVLVTAAIRGFGLRALGSDLWGGNAYVQIIINSVFFLSMRQMELTYKQCKTIVVAILLLSCLPWLASLLYSFTNGKIYQQFYFIAPDISAALYSETLEQGAKVARIQSMAPTAMLLPIIAFWLPRNSLFGQIRHALLLIAAFILSGFSGHRGSIIVIVLTILIIGFINNKGSARIINRYSMTLAACMMLAIIFARHLPVSYQRTLSAIPFTHVSYEAKISAEQTSSWRMEIIERILPEVPRYLLLGKGHAFHPRDVPGWNVSYGMTEEQSILIAIATHNYHNGPLTILIDLGLAGLLTSIIFFVITIRNHIKKLKDPKAFTEKSMLLLHRNLLAFYIATVFLVFFINGNPDSIPVLFYWTVLLDCFVRADIKAQELKAAPAISATHNTHPYSGPLLSHSRGA